LLIAPSVGQELFPLSIIHLNDIHARFDETNIYSNTCKKGDVCIGGYARVVTKVKELLERRPNPIYLNAGDNFQGTLWYNIHRWNVTSEMLNLLPADAMVKIQDEHLKISFKKYFFKLYIRQLEIMNSIMALMGLFHSWTQ
jgi:2',3'-cyclic-nucleotide 2'-phosphodiesterase (5'-nucleotidase family)